MYLDVNCAWRNKSYPALGRDPEKDLPWYVIQSLCDLQARLDHVRGAYR